MGATPFMPRYIAFGGGGMYGVSYVGVLDALEDRRGVECSRWGIVGVAGTSVGTIAALMVAIGLDRETRLRHSRTLSDMMSIAPCPDLHLLYQSFGWDRGVAFRSLLQEVLSAGGLSPDATLADMRRLVRLDFACVCTNLVTCKAVVLRADSHPTMRVIDAIYASCCVPFLFVPYEMDGMILVDGCLVENVPCSIFPPAETLVVCMDQNKPCVPQTLIQHVDSIIRCSTLTQYNMLDATGDAPLRIPIRITDHPFLSIGSIPQTVFDSLYQNGYASAFEFDSGGGVFVAAGQGLVRYLECLCAVTSRDETTSPHAGL